MGSYEYYLSHHGIKGQKWGVRRFQEHDGTLTAAGRAKYAKELEEYRFRNDKQAKTNMKEQGRKPAAKNPVNDAIRKTILSDFGRQAFANWRERRDAQNLKKAQDSGNVKKQKKYESKLAAQSKANADYRAYRDTTGSVKLDMQNAFMTPVIGRRYRKFRARGSSRLGALLKTGMPVVSAISNKKHYGKWIVWSGMEETND